MGLGFVFERTCHPRCDSCSATDAFADPFDRPCRIFEFKRHHQIQLRGDDEQPKVANPIKRRFVLMTSQDHDSFAGFRSDFIHASFSLVSPVHSRPQTEDRLENIFHLSPRAFQHFFRWWALFDALSIRIRHGKIWGPSKPSKKFSRYIATIKYRLEVEHLFITHVYKHDTRDAWNRGETTFIGVKALAQSFHADLHQASQKVPVGRKVKGARKAYHKIFSLVEVVAAGIELRALAAVFAEHRKTQLPLRDEVSSSLSQPWDDLEPLDPSSTWLNFDDFVELDWHAGASHPQVYLTDVASCPRFVYVKHANPQHVFPPSVHEDLREGSVAELSKFGHEPTHVCLIGQEDCK